jgi:hypothetical protein
MRRGVAWRGVAWIPIGNWVYLFHFQQQQITITESHFLNRFEFTMALEREFL